MIRLFVYEALCLLPEPLRNPRYAPDPVYYPSEREVLDIYADRFGISEEDAVHRQLHPGALSSALQRPEQAAHYEDVDFVRQAAILAHALSEGHLFSDGNKRVAYDTTLTFIEVHGYRLGVSESRFTAWLVMLSAPETAEGRERWTVDDFEYHLRAKLTLAPSLLIRPETYKYLGEAEEPRDTP